MRFQKYPDTCGRGLKLLADSPMCDSPHGLSSSLPRHVKLVMFNHYYRANNFALNQMVLI